MPFSFLGQGMARKDPTGILFVPSLFSSLGAGGLLLSVLNSFSGFAGYVLYHILEGLLLCVHLPLSGHSTLSY